MAVYAYLPTTNLKWDDIRDTLNANGGTVTNDVSTAFQTTANINKWSKHKPVKSLILFPTNFSYLDEAQYGLSIPYMKHPIVNGELVHNIWQYNIPDTDTDAKRLCDFKNYSPQAIPCVSCNFPSKISVLNKQLIFEGNLYISLDSYISGFNSYYMVSFRNFATQDMLECFLCVGMYYKEGETLHSYYLTSNKKILDYINDNEYGYITIENLQNKLPSWIKNDINITYKLFLTNQDLADGAIEILNDRSYSLECEENSDRKTLHIQKISVTEYIETTINFEIERVNETYSRFSKIEITSKRTDNILQDLIEFKIHGGNEYSVNAPILATGNIQFDNNNTWSRIYLAGELNDNYFDYQSGLAQIYYIDIRTSDNQDSIAYKEKSYTL